MRSVVRRVFRDLGDIPTGLLPLGGGGSSTIAIFSLTSLKNETDLTSYSTSSIAPTANRLVIAIVASRSGVTEVTPTASGGGMTTWTQIATRIQVADQIQITAFRALQSSPTSGALTFDFGTTTQSWCMWSVFEISNVDTTGTNGANAIVQSATNEVTPGTSLSVTLSAFGNANNGCIGGFYGSDPGNNTVFLPGSGFTVIHDFRTPGADSDAGILTEYKVTNDTGVDATFSNSDAVGVAFEVKAA